MIAPIFNPTMADQQPHEQAAGSICDDELQRAIEQFGLPGIELEEASLDRELIRRFPSQKLFEHEMLPVGWEGQCVLMATANPLAFRAFNELACFSGLELKPVLARADAIRRSLREILGVGGGSVGGLGMEDSSYADEVDSTDKEDDGESLFVVKLVNELLAEAARQSASDVHLEPEGHLLSVRFRVDGVLHVQPVPQELHRFRAAIISRLKIMAKINIAEKRLPQDGRCQISIQGRSIDLRVSVIPMLHGEGIVLRLLDQHRADFDLAGIHFGEPLQAKWERLIARPHGLLLVTGPTGSGKTTTLYSSLTQIRSPKTKIITVEDPVEYQLRGISQIQVHGKIGLDFAAAVRSILRHDPDVVLIGEIRDKETARSAVQASLTGHLVLSTLHTNNAASAFTRLIDMGIEEYLVASTLQAVLAQRLVRRICAACKEPYRPRPADLPDDFPEPAKELWRGVGCRSCHQTGYSGRVAVFELLETDTTIRELCLTRASASSLHKAAITNGMHTLRQCGWSRVLAGETTIEEIARVCLYED